MALRPKLRWMLIAVAVVVAGIQFVPVERTNPAVEAAFNGPPEVERILRRSCYDCHSHETRWPWYSRVAPVSWTVAQHVRQGREHLNFSRWNAREEAEVARECLEEVKAGRMPLRLYLFGHPSARLSPADLQILETWASASAGGRSGTKEEQGEGEKHEREERQRE